MLQKERAQREQIENSYKRLLRKVRGSGSGAVAFGGQSPYNMTQDAVMGMYGP